MATQLEYVSFLKDNMEELKWNVEKSSVYEPDDEFPFLHEAAVIMYHNVLYTSWYNCPERELQGYTPICGRRSYDGGKTWTDLEILCDDKSEKIMYCPPVYGICEDKLYLFVNQMVAPDHMHALDLYVLNNETDQFELLWSKPIPFKVNTNVVTLPNGKLMLPGRIAELDGFPNTPAALLSDSGRIDDQWRLVKIAEDGKLTEGKELVHPEILVMWANDILYMFCRNDQQNIPLVYTSSDFGETWSEVCTHDIPYVASKIYAGNLKCGRTYLIANIEESDRSKLCVYFSDKSGRYFEKQLVLYDKRSNGIKDTEACHYPAAFENEGKLYIIATLNYEWSIRGAVMFVVNLAEFDW